MQTFQNRPEILIKSGDHAQQSQAAQQSGAKLNEAKLNEAKLSEAKVSEAKVNITRPLNEVEPRST
jgi:uncharacterized protein YjbI with pentapeptide repeats